MSRAGIDALDNVLEFFFLLNDLAIHLRAGDDRGRIVGEPAQEVNVFLNKDVPVALIEAPYNADDFALQDLVCVLVSLLYDQRNAYAVGDSQEATFSRIVRGSLTAS